MNKKPKESTVWVVWGIVMVIYTAMNGFFLTRGEAMKMEAILGWGIIMPILTNLVWWAIAFRFRTYFQRWWIFGITTAVFVGVTGFLTMLIASRGA